MSNQLDPSSNPTIDDSNTVKSTDKRDASHSRTGSVNTAPVSSPDTHTTGVPASATADSDGGEVRARFTNESQVENSKTSLLNKTKPQTSPLLSSTPPTVAKSLIRAYPYLLIVNKALSIITWTNDDYWVNLIILSSFALGVLYFESLVTWFGHLFVVAIITLYALLNNKIVEEANLHPTLDDVVQALTTTCIKADILLTPITSLSLTVYDIKRLLFTTVFLTPVYLVVTFFLIKPRVILLFSGIYLLTYHSTYSRVSRKMLWKIKLARLLCFYLTGLDFSQAKNHSLFAAAFAKVQKNNNLLNPLGNKADGAAGGGNKPVRFTYVIYENQRRWLGIGWTANLLSYERTPWTDEFLNESSSIESFTLPNPENNRYSLAQQSNQLSMSGARWRWVDKTWRLDLTNDGAITLPNSKRSKTTANPSTDEGFIYYDNTWKKPSTEDSYSKYTRRRRWIRTAELVFDNPTSTPGADPQPQSSPHNISYFESSTPDASFTTSSNSTGAADSNKSRRRKSLRFAEPDEANADKPHPQDASDHNNEDDHLKQSQWDTPASAVDKQREKEDKKSD